MSQGREDDVGEGGARGRVGGGGAVDGFVCPTDSNNLSVTRVETIYGAYTVKPKVFSDKRGFFQEVFNADKYPRVTDSLNGSSAKPVMRQVSLSRSRANTIRGIHCAPYAKLVQCTSGCVFDVIVDLRTCSPTFGQWFGVWLTEEDHQQLYVPARCGHGFFAGRQNSVLTYCQEGTYRPGADVELNPMDPEVGIKWPAAGTTGPETPPPPATRSSESHSPPVINARNASDYIISSKDRNAPLLRALRPRLLQISEDEGWCQSLSGGGGGGGGDDDDDDDDDHDRDFEPQEGGVDFLIFGASGFLGSRTVLELKRQGYRIAAASASARLEDFPGICSELRKHSPIRYGVICCAGTAGKPNIGWCETHEPETIQLNVVGQLNVAEACRQHIDPQGKPTHCTLIGTGCIYTYDASAGHPREGRAETAFSEEDRPNFLGNVYARLRVSLEQLLAPFDNVLLLRVTYPVDCETMHPKNLVAKLLRFSRVTAEPTSVTVMDDLWPRISRLVKRRAVGLLNFNSAGTTDNTRILGLWQKIVDPDHNAWEVDSAVCPEGTRAYAHLSCSKLQALDPEVQVLSAEEAIERAFRARVARLNNNK